MSLSTAVEKSMNAKTGLVSATYVSQVSCPKDCTWLKSGCYAEAGNAAFTTNRLNKAEGTSLDAALSEAESIRGLSGTFPLRLHIVGDCPNEISADIVSDACENFKNKVWSYTHAWRSVARVYWRKVSILASCETLRDTVAAMQRGYAASIVVSKFKSDKAWIENSEAGPIKVIPCPNQTKGVTCTKCQLCWKDTFLLKNKSVIAFETHGSRKNKMNEKLIILNS
jgi:hypothetical protein